MEAVDSVIETNLSTIIPNTPQLARLSFTGVRGHAPPEKCQNLRLKWCFLEHIKAQISSFLRGDTEGRAPLPLDHLLLGLWVA